MATKRDLSALGVRIGTMPSGAQGSITDVPGVTVGHCTVDTDTHKTGVTVIFPTQDDLFAHKCAAGCAVLNGFGKTAGLVQVEELGTLETPIALTNTLNVGAVQDAMVDYMVRTHPALRSVNPVVGECNDGGCNDIRTRAVGKAEVDVAIAAASATCAEGDVGAGKGMTCHGLKGGIGTASRLLCLGGTDYTLGVLVLANHGCLSDLTIAGDRVGQRIAAILAQTPAHVPAPSDAQKECDKGSCIIVMATDLPLTSRQITRVVRRAAVGLARVGSHLGHGSGDIALGFSTANRMPQASMPAFVPVTALNETLMDEPFRAMAEATEEAVLRALLCADALTGADGKHISCLSDFWPGT